MEEKISDIAAAGKTIRFGYRRVRLGAAKIIKQGES